MLIIYYYFILFYITVEQKESKIFTDQELVIIVDGTFEKADHNNDGFISWEEYMIEIKKTLETSTQHNQN